MKWCWTSTQFWWFHKSVIHRIFSLFCLLSLEAGVICHVGHYHNVTFEHCVHFFFLGIGNIYFVAQITKQIHTAERDILKVSSHHHELPVIKCWKLPHINWQLRELTPGKAFIILCTAWNQTWSENDWPKLRQSSQYHNLLKIGN